MVAAGRQGSKWGICKCVNDMNMMNVYVCVCVCSVRV